MHKQNGKAAAAWGAFWIAALLYWECILHLSVLEGAFRWYLLGYTLAAGLLVAAVTAFLPKRAAFGGNLGLSLIFMVYYGSQMVYSFIFGTLYSVALMGQGGAAVTSFWRETLAAMGKNFPWLVALAVPPVVLAVARKRRPDCFAPMGLAWRGVLAALGVCAFLLTGFGMKLAGTQMFSDYYYYHSTTTSTDQMAQRFGLLTAFRMELTGGDDEEEEEIYYIPQTEAAPQAPEEDATGPEEAEVVEYGYNVLELDMEELLAQADTKKHQTITQYCAQLTGTRKNEYTGMLADYNLILICGESFSPAAIHPELTPTLYRLSREGFVFENYFNSFPNTTTDGEYALLQGLWPDSSRGKNQPSFYASLRNDLPFVLGNALKEQRDVSSWGYHNYTGDYYSRDKTHPHLGYTMKFRNKGMTFQSRWPSSDLEMVEQSVDDYIGQEQFHAYYMTFSGHYQYSTKTNEMAKKNWDAVKDLPYASDEERAYLACNIELDKALEYLMQRLEEAGVAEKTAIVLAGDHFPYGLTQEQYSDMVGYETDAFTRYRSTLIFWVGGMEEPVTVSDYCCNVDILPTLLNLWGLEYDSRMLGGTDILSDSEHIAVLVDKSWMTDKVWFDANTGKARYLVPEEELPETYVEAHNQLVSTRFSISRDILNSNYYHFVLENIS